VAANTYDVLRNHTRTSRENRATIEFKGFSSKADCEKAGEAATEIFMLSKGLPDMIQSECKKG